MNDELDGNDRAMNDGLDGDDDAVEIGKRMDIVV
jgi:hypothetical protein